jgi:hypothetical protein
VRDNDVIGAVGAVSVTGGAFRVADNVVVGGDPGEGAEILFGVVVDDSWFAPSGAPTRIAGNRISQVRGFGIRLSTHAGSIQVAGNTLQGIQGIGIGTTTESAIAQVRIVENTIDGIDQFVQGPSGPTGIQVLQADQVVVAGNIVTNVITGSARITPIGVLLVSCGQTSVEGNRLYQIGFTGDADGGIGIGILSAADVSVIGNVVPFGVIANRGNWVGLVIRNPDALGQPSIDRDIFPSFAAEAFASRPEFPVLTPYVSPTFRGVDRPIVFSAAGISKAGSPDSPQSLIVTGNELSGGWAAGSAAVVSQGGDLLFADNSCTTIPAMGGEVSLSAGLIASVSSLRVNANRLQGGTLALRLAGDLSRVAVLGNVMNPESAWSGGTVPTTLPAPWDALNIYP